MMGRNCTVKSLLVALFLVLGVWSVSAQERVEMLPYGNLDTWTVRYIKESALLGGKTHALYVVGPTDTIYGNQPYPYGKNGSPWCTGNAYAKCMGVETVAITAVPEPRGNGYCCRLETVIRTVSAIGIDLKVLATGSLYTGRLMDPVTMEGSKDPIKAIDMGVPFTRCPKAFILDYKAHILPEGQMVSTNASTRIKNIPGHDEGEIVCMLQHRWEEDGHIYAYRVGTAIERVAKSTNGWQNNHRMDIRYGDLHQFGKVQPWEDLTSTRFMARNSKGKMVPVEEVGYRGDLTPTHLVLQVTAGSVRPFVGCPGNIMWCDNLRLVYGE